MWYLVLLIQQAMDRVIVEERIATPGCLGDQVGCSGLFRRPRRSRFLTLEGRRLDMPNKENRHLNDLLQAIRDNNLKHVQSIVEARFKRKDRTNFLAVGDASDRLAREIELAVMEASRLVDPTILKYLLKHGAQVNFVAPVPTETGAPIKVSPLHLAVDRGLAETVWLLLENNADVNRLDLEGRAALHLAVRRADCECVRMLLFRGADVHLLNNNGNTSLQMASKFGHVELVRILLEHSAQVFHEGQQGPSPLHVAAIEGHVPLIDIFSRYVDVNIRVPCTAEGQEKTALHLAAERGLIETVRFLLERFGADVNVLDSNDQNALHCALMHKHDHRRMRRKEDYDAMVDLFLKKQVKLDQRNADGNTALHLAAANQFHRVVEILLLARANPLLKNKAEQIPLDMIAEYDVPMRQLFSKYAVITSPYITDLAPLAQSLPATPAQQQRSATKTCDLSLQTTATLDLVQSPTAAAAAPLYPKLNVPPSPGRERQTAGAVPPPVLQRRSPHKASKAAPPPPPKSILKPTVDPHHHVKPVLKPSQPLPTHMVPIQSTTTTTTNATHAVFVAPPSSAAVITSCLAPTTQMAPHSARDNKSNGRRAGNNGAKVFHIHVKGVASESTTDEDLAGPHRSVVYAEPSRIVRVPSAPTLMS